jgi:hypothetical protein
MILFCPRSEIRCAAHGIEITTWQCIMSMQSRSAHICLHWKGQCQLQLIIIIRFCHGSCSLLYVTEAKCTGVAAVLIQVLRTTSHPAQVNTYDTINRIFCFATHLCSSSCLVSCMCNNVTGMHGINMVWYVSQVRDVNKCQHACRVTEVYQNESF